MKRLTLYHGSQDIIKKPMYGKGKIYNDYGQGFYCTEHLDLAKEWACNEKDGGYVNQYSIDISSLHILNLSLDHFTILHWLALLVENRKFRISTPIMKRGTEWLKEHFLLDVSHYDIIIGYRADDSYFSFAKAFLNNEISLKQLSYAMKLGKLGEQVVIKSEKAFDAIKFENAIAVNHQKYYPLKKEEMMMQEVHI